MLSAGEIQVWRIRLDRLPALPPTQGEAARAERFHFPEKRDEYLRAHAALRDILGRETEEDLLFAVTETGKPYLPGTPALRFNLSHSGQRALVAIAREIEVGVDVERLRRMPEWRRIAERFFPPSEAEAVDGEADFFRRWTRVEAVWKATGAGLYAAGVEQTGDWTVEGIDAGPGYAAAVAAPGKGLRITLHDYGAEA